MSRVLFLATLAIAAAGVRWEITPPPPAAIRAPRNPPAATAIERGHQVYRRYGCVMCHGADGKGGIANPNAETDGRVPGVTFVAEGYTRGELRRKILDGYPTVGKKDPNGPRPPFRMPGWAGQMTDAEVADLVEYLWSLYPKSETQKWR
ncbi:MAG: cytochrome c [Acidobacteria bacterium]|nr:cytochrome c [Acidobacteriota bacterium]